MPYALNEANFKKLFTFFVVLKSWKTQITNAVQSKNFYFLLASIQIRRARVPVGLRVVVPVELLDALQDLRTRRERMDVGQTTLQYTTKNIQHS